MEGPETRFPHRTDPLTDLLYLEQTGKVQDFYDAFNLLRGRVTLSEDIAVEVFLRGLDPTIQKSVRWFGPRNVKGAYCLAQLKESTIKRGVYQVFDEMSVREMASAIDVVTNLPELVEVEGITVIDVTPDPSTLTPKTQFMDSSSPMELKTNVEDVVSDFSDSLDASVGKAKSTLSSSLDSLNSSITSVIKSATEEIEKATSSLSSSMDQMGNSTGNRLANVSSDLRGAASKVGAIGGDVLRSAIVAIEGSLAKGASFVVYSYSFAKELLPSDIKESFYSPWKEKGTQLARKRPTYSKMQKSNLRLGFANLEDKVLRRGEYCYGLFFI